MSLLARYVPTLPASRRAYSSFFSSKAGGGRYFNSAKPPKTIDVNRPKTDNRAQDDNNQPQIQESSNGTSQLIKTPVQELHAPPLAATQQEDSKLADSPQWAQESIHSKVTAKDFKLHQFFALHRPLLLLSHPHSILSSPPNTTPLISTEQDEQHHHTVDSIEHTPEASHEADAECARLLSRVLTINYAGAAVDWQNTLQTLGLNTAESATRSSVHAEWYKQWSVDMANAERVNMDSVKRKKKKKMKKHKQRKRKRSLRATRLQTK